MKFKQLISFKKLFKLHFEAQQKYVLNYTWFVPPPWHSQWEMLQYTQGETVPIQNW